ncbi:LysE family transporter [Paenibacillus barengoltzii]|uniref:LysE family translocator n=1 Tax=Paenibacillus barengoltzii TaxID=343517 RepID=UPI000A08D244|nr:LysE family transporter [Paenibacillus barengoltzii]MEC2343854.1 LysE family transporter [Paenibacillus barengoltzii]SMF11974.1 Threonine/homoserine/homoserine lactone efflux protein [Paenibacillus barengoltzii]
MDITSFLMYCFIVTFTPGPTNIVILSTAHNYGAKKAMEYTYGSTIAFGLLLSISAILNTVLITILPKVLLFMQLIGTMYMLYLAYQIYRMDASEPTNNSTGTFVSGFLMQFLNPKVVLFTLTVIPSFILPYYTDMVTLTISVVVITIIGFLAFVTWVSFGELFKKFLQSHKRVVNIMMALCLVCATVMIWL